VASYELSFSDGSPQLIISELSDDRHAVSFAKIVAYEIARDQNKPAPAVIVSNPRGPIIAKECPLTCARCASEQRLFGIEQHSGEWRFTFVCTSCDALETRSVTSPASRSN
jgi:hypothetical protein